MSPSSEFDLATARRECRKSCPNTGTYRSYGKERPLHCHDRCRGCEAWLHRLWQVHFDVEKAMRIKFWLPLICTGWVVQEGDEGGWCVPAAGCDL